MGTTYLSLTTRDLRTKSRKIDLAASMKEMSHKQWNLNVLKLTWMTMDLHTRLRQVLNLTQGVKELNVNYLDQGAGLKGVNFARVKERVNINRVTMLQKIADYEGDDRNPDESQNQIQNKKRKLLGDECNRAAKKARGSNVK